MAKIIIPQEFQTTYQGADWYLTGFHDAEDGKPMQTRKQVDITRKSWLDSNQVWKAYYAGYTAGLMRRIQ